VPSIGFDAEALPEEHVLPSPLSPLSRNRVPGDGIVRPDVDAIAFGSNQPKHCAEPADVEAEELATHHRAWNVGAVLPPSIFCLWWRSAARGVAVVASYITVRRRITAMSSSLPSTIQIDEGAESRGRGCPGTVRSLFQTS